MTDCSAPVLVLIGFMGSGKSSVGRLLAANLGLPMLDTDALIVESEGMSIPEIFAQKGESAFRDAESAVLQRLLESCPPHGRVISTGGGIVLRPENVAKLRRLGLVIHLGASEEVIFERVSRNRNRPLLQTPNPRATIAELLSARTPLYIGAADLTVDTTARTHAEVAAVILEEARKRDASGFQ